jgi:hypothetical protein
MDGRNSHINIDRGVGLDRLGAENVGSNPI